MSSLQRLRVQAVSQSLFPATTLKAAINRLGFVQADPIRSPAAAQDLILRHRVERYRVGDLERLYDSLQIEEDMLYAYGFLSRDVWRLLHPRRTADLPKLEKKVLEVVRKFGPMHPRDLQEHFGSERVINAWGGYSKATTQALEDLHYRGLLRVARRDKGIRVYEDSSTLHEPVNAEGRLRKLVMVIANIFAPVPQKSLQETINRLRHSVPNAAMLRGIIDELIDDGTLTRETYDSLVYVKPTKKRGDISDDSDLGCTDLDISKTVRFLAPFDPIVWDRRRFEHLWGWPYRFEAYTPVRKRVRGYYAMPLLWGENVIGWANLNVADGRLHVETGFAGKRPRERAFTTELALEVARFEDFLNLERVTSSRRKS